MTDKKDMKNTAFNLLEKNETIVTKYYKLSTYIFLGVVVAHILFSCVYLIQFTPNNKYEVFQFTAFNITILIIEVFISRIAFMLGSRAGQLNDIRFCLLLSEFDFPIERFKDTATAIMLLRRDENKLKIFDIEKISENFSKANKKT